MCEDHGAQARRQGEHDMEVRRVEQAPLAIRDPAILRGALAGWAVAVQTRVEEWHLAAAVMTAVEVSSESSGAAVFEIAQHPSRFRGKRVRLAERLGKTPEDLRDRERRTRARVRVHQDGIWEAIASSGDLVFAMVAVLT